MQAFLSLIIPNYSQIISYREIKNKQLNSEKKYRERNNREKTRCEAKLEANVRSLFHRLNNSSSLVTNEETRMAALSRVASPYQDGLHP